MVSVGVWFQVILDISLRPTESCEAQHPSSDTSRLLCTKQGDIMVRKGHVVPSGITSIVMSQWRSRWCLIRDGQLWFYSDKGKGKVSQPAVGLGRCSVVPQPSPEHMYSFRIDLDGTQLATLEAKTAADMGQWLGFLLSQTGTRMEPEDLTYDYINTERISTIINAAKTSMYLMQRTHSEPNAYIENGPPGLQPSDDLYDDVASIGADPEVYLDVTPVRSFLHTSGGKLLTAQRESCAATSTPATPREEPPLDSPTAQTVELEPSNQNLELEPPRHTPEGPGPDGIRSERVSRAPHQRHRSILPPPPPPPQNQEPLAKTAPSPGHSPVPAAHQSPSSPGVSVAHKAPQPGPVLGPGSPGLPPLSPQSTRPKTLSAGCQAGAVEVKLGKNRTEADVRRYSEERDRLEKEREEVRSSLTGFKKERRETREGLHACQGDPKRKASLEAILKQKEEACREAENRRVEVELRLMEVRESLRKVEAGPFTLGTTLDSTHQDLHTSKVPSMAPTVAPPTPPSTNGTCGDSASPINCATALKNRPTSMMATSKVNVLQKAKVGF
ncbi:hypothetical protein CRUP_005799 [Coryphaenoides rupestris]|nr:hypothetical protein CRUP_005799 [Coryphaenoides rupestris]